MKCGNRGHMEPHAWRTYLTMLDPQRTYHHRSLSLLTLSPAHLTYHRSTAASTAVTKEQAARPLHTIEAAPERVLCTCVDSAGRSVSRGRDCRRGPVPFLSKQASKVDQMARGLCLPASTHLIFTSGEHLFNLEPTL